MAESADYIRQIYEADIGQPADEAGISYWQGTGLRGMDLIKAMRHSAGMDTQAYDDPAYNAFARTYRSRMLETMADRDNQLNDIRRNRTLALANLASQRKQSLTNVDNDFAARGMYRSGGTIRKRAQVGQEYDVQEATTDLGYANQENEAVRGAASTLADLSAQRDEQEVAARGRLTSNSIQQALAGTLAAQQARQATARTATSAQAAQARQPRPRAPRATDRPGIRTSSPTRYVRPTRKAENYG